MIKQWQKIGQTAGIKIAPKTGHEVRKGAGKRYRKLVSKLLGKLIRIRQKTGQKTRKIRKQR